MEFSVWIVGIVCLVNYLWLGVMYVTEHMDRRMPPRYSTIPGTNQQFLWIEDFHWFFGDLVGVPMIVAGMLHVVVEKPNQMWIFLVLAILCGAAGHMAFTSQDHKPDACYPDIGKVSITGWIHIPYFGIGVAAALMCIGNLVIGNLRGPVLWLALAGGLFYVIVWAIDLMTGHFAPLRKVV